MAIPIRNIYYLLSYAWDQLEQAARVRVDAEHASNLVELFARILTTGLNQLTRQGMERGYVESRDILAVLRGRVCCNETLNMMGFHCGRLVCDFEEMTHDTLLNQILKASLRRLSRAVDSTKARANLLQCLQRFHDVSDLDLDGSVFAKATVHRNNRAYGLLIDICQLLWRNLLPLRGGGEWELVDFVRDPRQMGLLFENFVRNFYRRHECRTGLHVRRENINWSWISRDAASRSLLPQMQTDICLRKAQRKILIECKFSWITRENRYESEKLISEHLYQLNAYMTNLPAIEENRTCQALLLYPADSATVQANYSAADRQICVRTVDLNQAWHEIEAELFEIIGVECPCTTDGALFP